MKVKIIQTGEIVNFISISNMNTTIIERDGKAERYRDDEIIFIKEETK